MAKRSERARMIAEIAALIDLELAAVRTHEARLDVLLTCTRTLEGAGTATSEPTPARTRRKNGLPSEPQEA